MEKMNEKNMEKRRNDEVTELGYICYNLFIDNVDLPDELLKNIKTQFNEIIRSSDGTGVNSDSLQQSAINVGYVCYSLFVDERLKNKTLIEKCKDINKLNSIIADNKVQYQTHNKDRINIDESVIDKEKQFNIDEQSDFKINIPSGMEPIPANFKQCKCGYRNESFANFCGKCGVRL